MTFSWTYKPIELTFKYFFKIWCPTFLYLITFGKTVLKGIERPQQTHNISLYADDILLYIQEPLTSTQELKQSSPSQKYLIMQ